MATFSLAKRFLICLFLSTFASCKLTENILQNFFNDLVDESLSILGRTEGCLVDPLHPPDKDNSNSANWKGKVVKYHVQDIAITGLSQIKRMTDLQVELDSPSSGRRNYVISTQLGYHNLSLTCNVNLCPSNLMSKIVRKTASIPISANVSNLIFAIVLEFSPPQNLIQIRELSLQKRPEIQITSRNLDEGDKENKIANFILKHAKSYINSKMESSIAKYLPHGKEMANTKLSAMIANKLAKRNGKCDLEKVQVKAGESGQCFV